MATDNPFSKDVRVRRAMQMALDLETMNDTYFKGTARWKPRGVLGDAIVGYTTPFEEWSEEVRKGYTYDPEGAEKLLDEAGYPRAADGIRIKATEHHFEHADFDYAQLAVSYWKAIGVNVEIITSEAATHGARQREYTYGDMISWISGMDFLDPVVALGLAYSKGGFNPSGYNDPEFDRLYEAARDAATIEEQQRAVKAADMYFTSNHVYVWGPNAPKFNAVQPWVRGYAGENSLGSDDRMAILARLWFDHGMKTEMGQ
jgi:peptide/nickel transport system substrate-binding protein